MFFWRLISLRENVEWLLRLPDLSPCDCFGVGGGGTYLENKCFCSIVQIFKSFEDLKKEIRIKIETIS